MIEFTIIGVNPIKNLDLWVQTLDVEIEYMVFSTQIAHSTMVYIRFIIAIPSTINITHTKTILIYMLRYLLCIRQKLKLC